MLICVSLSAAAGLTRHEEPPVGGNGTSCEDPANAGSWSCTLPSRTAVLILAAFIVGCGIVFDFLKERLEEHVRKANRPILHAFFGELMVGGFLSLLSFILVYSNALTQLSEQLFGEEEVRNEFLPAQTKRVLF